MVAQCSYLYTQLISLLTGGVNNELKKRANRDLYHLVAGTEKYFDALVTAMDREPEFLLNAVHCLKLEPEVRNNIGSILNVKEVSISLIGPFSSFSLSSLNPFLGA